MAQTTETPQPHKTPQVTTTTTTTTSQRQPSQRLHNTVIDIPSQTIRDQANVTHTTKPAGKWHMVDILTMKAIGSSHTWILHRGITVVEDTIGRN